MTFKEKIDCLIRVDKDYDTLKEIAFSLIAESEEKASNLEDSITKEQLEELLRMKRILEKDFSALESHLNKLVYLIKSIDARSKGLLSL